MTSYFKHFINTAIFKNIIMLIIYIIVGVTIEHFQLIERPAYWTLYGVIWGIYISNNSSNFKKEKENDTEIR